MPQPTIWGRVLALSAIVMCTAFALSASGKTADTKNGPVFAVVDFQKLSSSYKAKEAVEGDLRAMQQKFDARLSRRDQMPFLTEEEQKQLDDLYEKAPTAKSDADNNKIKELETKNRQKSDEIQALRQKKDDQLNDADRAKLKAADETFRDAQKRFTQLKEDLSNQINAFGKSKSDDLMVKMRESIKKVAEQKGVAIVFNSEVALYAGTDITDQVVSEINKK